MVIHDVYHLYYCCMKHMSLYIFQAAWINSTILWLKDFFNTKLQEMILKNDLSCLWVGQNACEFYSEHQERMEFSQIRVKHSQPKQSTKWRRFIGSVTINKVDTGIDLKDVKWNTLKIKNTSWNIFFSLANEHPTGIFVAHLQSKNGIPWIMYNVLNGI